RDIRRYHFRPVKGRIEQPNILTKHTHRITNNEKTNDQQNPSYLNLASARFSEYREKRGYSKTSCLGHSPGSFCFASLADGASGHSGPEVWQGRHRLYGKHSRGCRGPPR